MATLAARGGEGFAILCEATDSPSMLDMKRRLERTLPAMTGEQLCKGL
jgi:hypothetical protein